MPTKSCTLARRVSARQHRSRSRSTCDRQNHMCCCLNRVTRMTSNLSDLAYPGIFPALFPRNFVVRQIPGRLLISLVGIGSVNVDTCVYSRGLVSPPEGRVLLKHIGLECAKQRLCSPRLAYKPLTWPPRAFVQPLQPYRTGGKLTHVPFFKS